MSKHLLLTGGCGFLGHHVAEHILENTDWKITILDSLTYAGDVTRLTDIEGYDSSRVRIMWHDLRSPLGKTLVAKIGNVDYIWNCASNSHVDTSIAEPVDFVHNNVMVALNILE